MKCVLSVHLTLIWYINCNLECMFYAYVHLFLISPERWPQKISNFRIEIACLTWVNYIKRTLILVVWVSSLISVWVINWRFYTLFLYFNNINKEITSISWTWSSIMFCWCLIVPSSSLFRSKSVLPSSAASCKSVKNKIEHLNHVEFNSGFHFKLSILKAIWINLCVH